LFGLWSYCESNNSVILGQMKKRSFFPSLLILCFIGLSFTRSFDCLQQSSYLLLPNLIVYINLNIHLLVLLFVLQCILYNLQVSYQLMRIRERIGGVIKICFRFYCNFVLDFWNCLCSIYQSNTISMLIQIAVSIN